MAKTEENESGGMGVQTAQNGFTAAVQEQTSASMTATDAARRKSGAAVDARRLSPGRSRGRSREGGGPRLQVMRAWVSVKRSGLGADP